MQKIPTLFLRDPETNMKTLTREVHPECQWVIDGEGVATRKFDGSCAMIKYGRYYKRREVKPGKKDPENFVLVQEDQNTGKRIGWVPVTDSPQDKYFLEAFDPELPDGTYELVGPKVQGNSDGYENHELVPHGVERVEGAPRTYDGLRDFLKDYPHEGIVWHHPDGRMAKIKRKDFAY